MMKSALSVTSPAKKSPFRLGLYLGRHAGGGGGIAVYCRELLLNYQKALSEGEFPRVTLYVYASRSTLGQIMTPALQNGLDRAVDDNSRTVVMRTLPEAGGRKTGMLADIISLGLFARKDRIDLLHCTANFGCFFPGRPQMITVHDLYQGWPPGNRRFSVTQLFYRALSYRQFPRASQLIVDSPCIAEELKTRLDIPASRISSIPLGLDSELIDFLQSEGRAEASVQRLAALGLEPGYTLHFASSDQRKNTERAVKAWSQLPPTARERKLVLKTNDPDAHAIARRILAAEDYEKHVRILPWVSREDLLYLYLGAGASLIPSLAEGFGFPALESAALGTPTVSPELDCLRSLGKERIWFCDPLSIDSIRDALSEALSQKRSPPSAAGFHTMQQAANDTLNLSLELLLRAS